MFCKENIFIIYMK